MIEKHVEQTPRVTLRVNILSVFLALVFVAFTAVLLFLGIKNREAIEDLSEQVMGFVREEIDHNLNDLFISTERVVTVLSNLYRSPKEIDSNNEQMRFFMLGAVKTYDNLAFLYIGTEQGETFTAGDLSFSGQTTYFSKPGVPLPAKAAYLWQTITFVDGQLYETSYYVDEQFNVLGSEKYLQPNYDPRKRPWYLGAKETKGIYWSDVYSFFETEHPGITGANPLYDSQGKLFGVVGADLSFELLSKFFASQTVGKSGKPFILDKKGNIVLPENKPQFFSTISPQVVAKAFQVYQEMQKPQFHFEWQGVRYIGHIEPFPLKNGEHWLTAILVPHSDFFAQIEETQRSAILIVVVILGLASLGVIFFAARLSRPIVLLAREVDKVRQLDFSKEERVHSRIKEIYLMDQAIALMRSAVQSFIHYVPKEIVQELFSQNKAIALGGEKKEVTVFFSDIEGFTSITEAQPTDALMALLAEYFDGMSKIILAALGTIDKYIGDSVMAFWGAPRPLPEHSAACAEAALRCHAFVQAFNKRSEERGLPLFKTRFGINAGVAIVGNIGTPERMNYTLIGDMVNTAARIQPQNKVYGTSILIGEAVKKQLDERFVLRPIDLVEVRGKKDKIALFELMAMQGGPPEIAPTSKMLDLGIRFSRAYAALQEGKREEAKQLFEELLRDFPEDRPTQIYLERLQ